MLSGKILRHPRGACAIKRPRKWGNLCRRSRTDGTNRSRILNKRNKFPQGDQEVEITFMKETN